MLYASLLILVLFLSVYFDFGDRRKSASYTPWLLLVWFIIVLIVGFRYRVGSDTIRYMDDFKHIHDLSTMTSKDLFHDEKFMPLSYLFFSICKTISNSFYFLQFAHAIFINTAVFVFLRRNTKYVFTGVLFYLICNSLEFNTEVIRESMAVSVFLLGVNNLFNKKYLKYYIYCIVAFGFHVSALLAFVFPLLLLIKVNALSVAIAAAIMIALDRLYEALPQVFSLLSFLGGNVEDLIESYYREGEEANLNRYLLHAIRWVVMPIVVVLLNMINKKKNTSFESNYMGLVLIIMILSFLGLYSYGFYRFNNYLMPFMWLLMARAAINLKDFRITKIIPARKFICSLVFTLYILCSVWVAEIATGVENFKSYYPYTSIFNEEYVYRPEW